MPWWSGFLFLAILCLNNGLIQSQSWQDNRRNPYQNSNSNIDIQFDNEPLEMSEGSGKGGFPSDDEDFGLSGSGSGSGFGDMTDEGEEPKYTPPPTSTTTTTTTTTTTAVTKRPLSNCEMDRNHNENIGKKKPDCLKNGDYAPMQCLDLPGTADCWCVDMNNREIYGTRMEAPNMPSCEDGGNLTPCVFELVKAHRPPMRFGQFRPKCSPDGQYEKQQCVGSICYCVDEDTGKKIPGSEVSRPDRPDCEGTDVDHVLPDDKKDEDENDIEFGRSEGSIDSEEEEITAVTSRPTYENKKPDSGKDGDAQIVFPDIDSTDEDDVNIDLDSDKDKESKDDDDSEEESNNTGGKDGEIGRQGGDETRSSVETADPIISQPGILAGIIGGSVVLLLCIVLLIMFIVYRMRKKDEGSYPLDEPRRPANYAYVRTPDREFYA